LVKSTTTGERQPPTTATTLFKKWGISLETAANIIRVTTKRGVWYSVNPLHCRWRTCQAHHQYPVLNTTVYSDTMFVNLKTHAGIGGDKCAQVFTTPFDFIKFYPKKSKVEAGHKLDKFVHNIGVMKDLHTDGAKEDYNFVSGKTVKYDHTHQTITGPYSSNQNRAKIAIQDLGRAIQHHSKQKASPFRLWNLLGPW
jgi:hypothetical protein